MADSVLPVHLFIGASLFRTPGMSQLLEITMERDRQKDRDRATERERREEKRHQEAERRDSQVTLEGHCELLLFINSNPLLLKTCYKFPSTVHGVCWEWLFAQS